jgi:hypothetical protein
MAMLTKRSVAIMMAVCMAILLVSPAAYSEGLLAGDLTSSMLFDLVFFEASDASSTIDAIHTFSPLYSNGCWVKTYYTFGSEYMQVLMTSPGTQGRVIAANIISDGEESRMLRELCGYAIAGLTLEIPGNITELIESGDSLNEMASKMDIESAGYTFSIKDDGTVMYASLETVHPYEVEQRLDIPTDQSVMYPLPPDTMSVQSFIEKYEQVLADHYGISDFMMYLGTTESGTGEWMQIYSIMNTPFSFITEEPRDSSIIRHVNIIDFQGDSPLLVGLASAAFGTLANFDAEQYAAMGLLAGARTTFDDYLSFLPTIAYNDMMLLFGITQEMGAAYIMGVPGR